MAKRISSCMLIVNAWHARPDAASSLVVAVGVTGSLMGYHWFDLVATCVVELMVGRVGARFGWEALNDLMDRALPPVQVGTTRVSFRAMPGVMNVHDLRMRVTGDQALADAHTKMDPHVFVSEGHATAVRAYTSVPVAYAAMAVLDIRIHINPHEHIATDSMPLPDRDTLHAVLAQLLPPGTPLGARHCVLYYVDGAVEVNLILPSALAGEPARITDAVSMRWDGLVRLRVLVTDA